MIPVHDVRLDICIHAPIQRDHLPSPLLEDLTYRPSASEQLEDSHTIDLYISLRNLILSFRIVWGRIMFICSLSKFDVQLF